MKLALYSDLHLEYAPWQPPALDVDIVVLAGDVGVGTKGVEWAAQTFLATRDQAPAVLYVPGNHEFYGADIDALRGELHGVATSLGITLLDNRCVQIGAVRFLGTTLWSDFALYGSESWTKRSIATAATSISDYAAIRRGNRRLTPRDTMALHQEASAWLADQLAQPFNGTTVVVTHFAPHRQCVAPKYDGDVLSPYFVVNMAPLMRAHRIDLWVFGHTHHNVDFITESGCRVISNQRGYPHESGRSATGFRPELIIDPGAAT